VNALDWVQVAGAILAFLVGIYILVRGPGVALRLGGLGVMLLAIGFGVGGIEGVDTSGFDWLEATGVALGTVLVTAALAAMAVRGGAQPRRNAAR
jgi:hypothetical protein